MRARIVAVLSLVLVTAPQAALSEGNADAAQWVIGDDISPFRLDGDVRLVTGTGANTSDLFGRDPRTIQAEASYVDHGRQIGADVEVSREIDTEYLDHMLTDTFVNPETGHFERGRSMVSVLGNVVYFACQDAPNCTHRSYTWRTASNILVLITAGAGPDFGPTATPGRRPEDIGKPITYYPTPEPTELLQAYLQRYPSALTMYEDNDQRARQ